MAIWRSTSPSSLAAWGNAPLRERVLDLLADMLFATDELREMVAVEPGLDRMPDFDERMQRVYREIDSTMKEVLEKTAP